LRTIHLGPENVLLNASLDYRDTTTLPEVEATVTRLEARIRESFPEIKHIFIEAQAKEVQPDIRFGVPES